MNTIISGSGCVCALGGDLSEISGNLFNGYRAHSYALSRFESSYLKDYPVFQAPQKVLSQKKESESFSFLFLRLAAEEALKKAGFSDADLQSARIGACIGTSVDASFNLFDFYKAWRKDSSPDVSPLNKYISYSCAGEILKNFNLTGVHQTIATACSSGTDAIGVAAEWIDNSLCDVAIAGATDELNLIPFTGFIKLMIAGKTPCKPFDKNRNGINLGEGAGVFILESQTHFEKRTEGKNKKEGVVLGYGNACDGYHNTAPHPDARGLRKAVDFALKQAKKTASDLSFINAHATGTIDNDAAEAKVFSSVLKGVPVSATKSRTGHALGAAGAVEACLALACINEGKIPPTANFENPDENLNFSPVCELTEIDCSKPAMSNSLSFGGCNSVLILGGRNYE